MDAANDITQHRSLIERVWFAQVCIDHDESQRRKKPKLSSAETLRVLQEIPNELIFVLDVVIAVRAGECSACAG